MRSLRSQPPFPFHCSVERWKIVGVFVDSCRTCEAPVQRVFHPIAVHFKGSGFYNTDYGTRKRSREKGEGGEGTSTSDSKSDSKPSGDSGSKSESKSESKTSTAPAAD